MNNVYIMSANRSAIGGFGGTLKNHCPVDLGTLVAKEAIARSGYEANELSMLFLVMLYIQNQEICM